MLHRWHINHPYLLLVMLLLLAWAVVYAVARFENLELGGAFDAPVAAPADPDGVVAIAPGHNVPRDYFVQEKTYRAPAAELLTITPGYRVPRDYFAQEKTYRAPAAEVAP